MGPYKKKLAMGLHLAALELGGSVTGVGASTPDHPPPSAPSVQAFWVTYFGPKTTNFGRVFHNNLWTVEG